MAYEIYAKQVVRATSPMITLNSRGRLAFNVAATRILHEQGFDTVFLLWDADAKKFAVRATNTKKDARTHRVRFAGKDAKWGSISAKGFLEHIGHDLSATKAYPATWNTDESMFEVSMEEPKEETVKEGTGHPRRPVLARAAGLSRSVR